MNRYHMDELLFLVYHAAGTPHTRRGSHVGLAFFRNFFARCVVGSRICHVYRRLDLYHYKDSVQLPNLNGKGRQEGRGETHEDFWTMDTRNTYKSGSISKGIFLSSSFGNPSRAVSTVRFNGDESITSALSNKFGYVFDKDNACSLPSSVK